jgi:Glutaredoxin-like domain (DUF836)
MRAVVERVLPEVGAGLEERDVRDDPALEALYVFEIPVLLLGDREIARHRVTESELRLLLTEAGLGRSKGD